MSVKPIVFISYCRKNCGPATALSDALAAQGYDVLIDLESIEGGEPWRERLHELLVRSEAVLVVLTDDWVKSPVCQWELERAAELGKRLVPVAWSIPRRAAVPAEIARLNWLRRPRAWSAKRAAISLMPDLSGCLNTDLNWHRELARVLALASAWDGREREPAFLMRGNALSAALIWASKRPGDLGHLPSLVAAFLDESERLEASEAHSKKRLIGLGFVGAVEAALNANRAFDALRLVGAGAVLAEDPHFHVVPELWRAGCRAILGTIPPTVLWGHRGSVECATFHPSKDHVLTASYDGSAKLWDELGNESLSVDHGEAICHATFDPAGELFATCSDATVDGGRVRVWSAGTGQCFLDASLYNTFIDDVTFDRQSRSLLLTRNLREGYKIVPLGAEERTTEFWRPKNDRWTAYFLERGPNPNENSEWAYMYPDWVDRVARDASQWLSDVPVSSVLGFSKTGDVLISKDETYLWLRAGMTLGVYVSCRSDINARRTRRLDTEQLEDDFAIVVADAAPSGSLIKTLAGHVNKVNVVTLSPDATRGFTSCKRVSFIWNVDTGEPIETMQFSESVSHAAFSPDGRLLAVAAWGVFVYDTQTGACVTEYEDGRPSADSVRFIDNGSIEICCDGQFDIVRLAGDVAPAAERRAPGDDDAPRALLSVDSEIESEWTRDPVQAVELLADFGAHLPSDVSASYTTPNGRRTLLGCSEGQVVLFDTARLTLFDGRRAAFVCAALSKGVGRKLRRDARDPLLAEAPHDLFSTLLDLAPELADDVQALSTRLRAPYGDECYSTS